MSAPELKKAGPANPSTDKKERQPRRQRRNQKKQGQKEGKKEKKNGKPNGGKRRNRGGKKNQLGGNGSGPVAVINIGRYLPRGATFKSGVLSVPFIRVGIKSAGQLASYGIRQAAAFKRANDRLIEDYLNLQFSGKSKVSESERFEAREGIVARIKRQQAVTRARSQMVSGLNEGEGRSVSYFGGGAVDPGSAGGLKVGLAECAAMYAKAVANPFGTFATLPCVPCEPPVESMRWRALRKGTMKTNGVAGQGLGFIVAKPFCSGNDQNSIFVSTAYALAPSVAVDVGAAGVTAVTKANLPYSATDMGSTVLARLVGCAIRIKNASALGNVGGLIFAGQVDDTDNLLNYTPAQLEAMPDWPTVRPSAEVQDDDTQEGGWATIVFRPQGMNAIDWYTWSGPSDNNPTFAIFVQDPGAAQTYFYEYVEFWEFTGSSTTITLPAVEVSDSDPVGLARVMEAAQRMPLNLEQDEYCKQMAVGCVEEIAHSDSVAKTVEDLLGTALSIGKAVPMIGSLFDFLSF